MKTKQAAEVASNLVNKVFAYFGLPTILHSDNGKEFVANIVVKVVEKWPGKCTLVNGGARKPWVQGC